MKNSNVRVRIAPSPTGYLHIGTARTALYNYLYAKATGGTYILRVEDTDLERSKKEFEISQLNDLKWLGLDYDEGPEKPKDCGPYRQSERLPIYKEFAEKLVASNNAYYCFCTDEELEKKRESAKEDNRDSHYDGTCKKFSLEEAREKLKRGEKGAVRFKAFDKDYSFFDSVRKEVSFPSGMVGDFVILRSNGLPVYNFCCVVDDYLMKITHVIRGEDHLSNTLRQLMIYEALKVTPPQFAHLSLLVGTDRQKLSKRHGATSASFYRESGYLPEAINNYLCLLGWSHPEEKNVFNVDELTSIFDLNRFIKSPALYDPQKLKWINGQHIQKLENQKIKEYLDQLLSKESKYFSESDEWRVKFAGMIKEKIELFSDAEKFIELVFNEGVDNSTDFQEVIGWETTPQIIKYLHQELQVFTDSVNFLDVKVVDAWSEKLNKEFKIKGKFLFKGLRAVLSGSAEGPDLKVLSTLIPLKIIKKRVSDLFSRLN